MKGCKLVTSDAQSFYTNINMDHAINVLGQLFILHSQNIPPNFPVDVVLLGIKRLMKNNVFTFGSKFFL